MHDAAPKYEPDTLIVEMPAIGRVSTEDLVAHVIVDGLRHRRTPDLRETACGEELHSQFAVPVREALTFADGKPCSGCFTSHEIKRAAENDAAMAKAEEEAQKQRDSAAELRRLRMKRPTEGDL